MRHVTLAAVLLLCLAAAPATQPATQPSPVHLAVSTYKAARTQFDRANTEAKRANDASDAATKKSLELLQSDASWKKANADVEFLRATLEKSRSSGESAAGRIALSSDFNAKRTALQKIESDWLNHDDEVRKSKGEQNSANARQLDFAEKLAKAYERIFELRGVASGLDRGSRQYTNWQDGSVGTTSQAVRVISIVDAKSAIVTVNRGVSGDTIVWMEGWDTAKLTTDSLVDLRQTVFQVSGTHRYATVMGGENQVLRIVPWSLASAIPDLSELDSVPTESPVVTKPAAVRKKFK